MAIYHCSVKTISRSHGRSATASCAYRTGTEITDERTGEYFDYSRKRGIEHTEILTPNNSPSWANDRNALWNAVEKKETRKNSTVAREVVSALPHELTKEQHIKLARDFANDLVERYKVAIDIAIHAPDRGGDDKNHHVHFLMSTRRLEAEGFTKKTRELDERKSGEINYIRKNWENRVNQYLERENIQERIDCRSHRERRLEQTPTQHMGVHATQIERKGEPTRIGDKNREIESWNRDLYNREQDLKIIDFAIEKEKRRLAKEKEQRYSVKRSNDNKIQEKYSKKNEPVLIDTEIQLRQLDEKQALERKQAEKREALHQSLSIHYDLASREENRDNLYQNTLSAFRKMTGQGREDKESLEAEEKTIFYIKQRIAEAKNKLELEHQKETKKLINRHSLALSPESEPSFDKISRDNRAISDRVKNRLRKRGFDR